MASDVDHSAVDYDWEPTATMRKGKHDVIARKRRFKGSTFFDIREHGQDGRPTSKGVTLPLDKVQEFGRALAAFEPDEE